MFYRLLIRYRGLSFENKLSKLKLRFLLPKPFTYLYVFDAELCIFKLVDIFWEIQYQITNYNDFGD